MFVNHKVVAVAVAAALAVVVGCTSSTSPSGISRGAVGSPSGATILGSINGTGAPRSVAGGPGSSMRVTVVGTDLAAAVSGGGRFQLDGVPAGDVVLKFSDTNVDAAAFVAGVSDGEEVELQITLAETTASIVSETRRMTKVQLCHRTGNGSYHLIDIAAAAEPAHRGHGDGAIGDPVPADPTLRFNEDCEPDTLAVIIEKATNGADADRGPGPSIAVGAAVSWTYVVTNVGLVPLTGIVVSDDQGVLVDCPSVTSLAVGASMTCTGFGLAALGPYVNVGTVNALSGATSVTDSDPSHYLGVEPTEGPKVQLCHGTGNGSFHLISVGAPAEPAHLAHGDGKPGEAVPNQAGSVFGPTCGVTTAAPPVAP
jgi:hypothetical protein